MVRSVPLPELTERYHNVVSHAEAFNRPFRPGSQESLFPDHPPAQPWCTQHIFSDTVVLIADSTSADSSLRLLVWAWRLFQFFLSAGFPLRGAVTHGEVSIDQQSRIYLGPALVDAYELERSQQWVGAAIDASVLGAHPDLARHMAAESNILSDIFPLHAVPMEGATREMHTFNWRFNLVVKNGTRSLFPPVDDPRAAEKQQNAIAFARAVRASGRVYTQGERQPPLELRAYFVGDSEPPFTHGDDL